jgi:hypothetical protein
VTLSDTPFSGSGPSLEPSSPNRGSTADVAANKLLSIQSYRCSDAVVVVAGEIDMLTAARMQEN